MKERKYEELTLRIQQTLHKKFSAEELSKKSPEELIEELSIYYQELELQNEELQTILQELETRTKQYEDLYENAPIGYVTYTPCIIQLRMPDSSPLSLRVESNLLVPPGSYTHPLIRSALIDISRQVEAEKRAAELLEQLKEKNYLLQEFQNRLDTALTIGKIFWWSLEFPTGYLQAHPKKAENLGYSAKNFTHYTHFTNLLHPADSEAVFQDMRNLLNGRQPHYSIEYRIRDANGKYRWYYDFGTITKRDEHQNPILVQGVTMDITHRKEVELELQQQLSNLKSIIGLLKQETSSEEELLNFAMNEALKLANCSRGCLYSYTTDQYTLSLQTVVCRMEESTPCPSPSRRLLNELMTGKHNYIIEDNLLYIPIFYPSRFVGLLILKDSDVSHMEGVLLQLSILFRTTWERLEKVKADVLKETYYRALRDIQQPVVITDKHGIITDANEAFLSMYEYKREDVIGKNPRILNPGKEVYKNLGYSEEYYKTLFREMWETILDPARGQWQGILINRKKSGTLVWTQTFISAIRDTSGNIQYFIGLPVDITTLKDREYRSKIDLYRTIARLSELRDNETGNHMRRVGIYARLLAKALGMPEKFCEEIELFAPMHDIGKVGISDTILLVNRSLTDDEYEEIKKHTLLGYNIVRDKEELRTAADIILYHHERWDGTGYPYGLKEEAIPLSARITAIADVYDALRSKRPYKEEWPHEQAVAEIVKSSGKAFDPRLIQVFLQLSRQFDEVYTKLKD